MPWSIAGESSARANEGRNYHRISMPEKFPFSMPLKPNGNAKGIDALCATEVIKA
jgi:hypothetical protein